MSNQAVTIFKVPNLTGTGTPLKSDPVYNAVENDAIRFRFMLAHKASYPGPPSSPAVATAPVAGQTVYDLGGYDIFHSPISGHGDGTVGVTTPGIMPYAGGGFDFTSTDAAANHVAAPAAVMADIANPLSGAVGAVVSGYQSGTTFTITAVASGTLAPGMDASSGLSAGTRVMKLLSGTLGAVGSTYQMSVSQTAGSTSSPVACNFSAETQSFCMVGYFKPPASADWITTGAASIMGDAPDNVAAGALGNVNMFGYTTPGRLQVRRQTAASTGETGLVADVAAFQTFTQVAWWRTATEAKLSIRTASGTVTGTGSVGKNNTNTSSFGANILRWGRPAIFSSAGVKTFFNGMRLYGGMMINCARYTPVDMDAFLQADFDRVAALGDYS